MQALLQVHCVVVGVQVHQPHGASGGFGDGPQDRVRDAVVAPSRDGDNAPGGRDKEKGSAARSLK